MNQRLEQINAALIVLHDEKQSILDAESERANAAQAEADRKTRNEIKDLVESYNRNEADQAQRLARLFLLLKQRRGDRRVSFSNGSGWVNCWTGPDRTDRLYYIEPKLAIMITDIEPGI